METNKDENATTIISTEIRDRILGSFYGLAWGDVFGCPIEGWKEGGIRDIWGTYNSLPEDYPIEKLKQFANPKVIRHIRPIGLYSDDTQQCMALLHCLNANKMSWNPKSWCEYLKEGVKSKSFRGFGRNFALSVGNISKGVTYTKCGSPSSGMGAAMRIGPLGALLRNDEKLMSKVVVESSLITHGSLVAAALSYAVAYTVYSFVNGKSIEDVRKELPSAVSEIEKHWLLNEPTWEIDREDYHFISSSLRTIFSTPELSQASELRAFISKNAKPFLAEGFNKAHPNQGFAGLGGLHGLCMALLPGDVNPQDILNTIVQLGYDTDTVAAIAGSVLGARFGVNWIPLQRLTDLERLTIYANTVLDCGSEKLESFSEFISKELQWTNEEKRYKQEMMKLVEEKPQQHRRKR